MNKSFLLRVDAAVNIGLGTLLLLFPPRLVALLGVPGSPTSFYPNLLGAVLFGIGIALLWETRLPGTGLALKGAVSINLCGGLVLALWLLFGDLSLPTRGAVFLWFLVILLLGLSAIRTAFNAIC